ncbi:MAG: hypothetical protein F4X64_11040 [Chloroflexi bacterium]|nr:hypothetical protein [Chloroflexota bacterium]
MSTHQKPVALTPTAKLLEKALLAKEQSPKIAPRLLLEALQQRIREVVPDHHPDLWVAARKLARDKDDIGIEAAYWSLMMFDRDFGERGNFNEEQWEDGYDVAEITIRLLEQEHA